MSWRNAQRASLLQGGDSWKFLTEEKIKRYWTSLQSIQVKISYPVWNLTATRWKKPDSKLQGAIKGKGSSIMAVRQIAALRRCRDGKGAIGGLLSFRERNWSRNRRINSLGCNKATSWLLLLSPFPDESDGENHAADYHWGIESTYMSGAYIDHKSILI